MNTEDVNRGYLKLEGAVNAFKFDFRGKTVLDIGSSTGGFTELALNRGANKVIAVEKGTNQMKSPLRYDQRIELHEKTDIFSVRTVNSFSKDHKPDATTPYPNDRTTWNASEEKLIVVPDTIIADVSFISLTKILFYAKRNLSDAHTEFLVMLKPQFEAKSFQLRNGVVKNETIRREIIRQFEYWLKQNGYIVIKKHDNELHGKTGNIERFYYLKLAK